MRALLVPALVSYGSFALWASENTATDIVKDSVVAAYLLDFDSSVTYPLFPQRLRNAYETRPGFAVAPGRTPTTIEMGKWSVWFVCTWFMTDLLLGNWGVTTACASLWWSHSRATAGFDCDGTPTEAGKHSDTLTPVMYMIAAIHAVVNASLVWRSKEHNGGVFAALSACSDSAGATKGIKAALIVVTMGTMFAMAPLAEAIKDGFEGQFAYSYELIVEQGTALAHCLNQWGTSDFCSMTNDLHGVPPPG